MNKTEISATVFIKAKQVLENKSTVFIENTITVLD